MNTYKALKDKHQAECNAFPLKFAFSQEQFDKAMTELGLKPKDTKKVTSIGYGGFTLNDNAPKWYALLSRQERECAEAIANDIDGTGYIQEMWDYELANHEYIITCDISDAQSALGISDEQLVNDKRIYNAMKRACKKQMDREDLW